MQNNHIRILIYSNCAGNIIKRMFENHNNTKKFIIDYIANYEQCHTKTLMPGHLEKLSNCDYFFYQPFNNDNYEEYNIKNVITYLKTSCKILRINYYRFKGFWLKDTFSPYNEIDGRSYFLNHEYYGIHKNFMECSDDNNNNNVDFLHIRERINSIYINDEYILENFNTELEKFKMIDDNSDVKLYDFFMDNYKDKRLFYDVFHPTNLFFYEIFRQLLEKFDIVIPKEDPLFLESLKNTEMAHWALPILPQIKKCLGLNFYDGLYVFNKNENESLIKISMEEYYYVRLSIDNLEKITNIKNVDDNNKVKTIY